MGQSRSKLRKRGKQNKATKKIRNWKETWKQENIGPEPDSETAMARKIPPPREVPDPPECQVGRKGGQEGRQQTEQDAEQGTVVGILTHRNLIT